ncbi:MAG: hypothetical protein K2K65_05005, partial [Duncaniella sp.]|nr:hypothetical protein [Duncaniella sp.]
KTRPVREDDINWVFILYVPFIITDELKFYYNGLRNWPEIKGYLTDTCLTAQDNFKIILSRFRIKYDD